MSDETITIPSLSMNQQTSVLWNLFERYTSRKFVLCLMIQVAAIVALFDKLMEPATWLAVSSLVLSSYFAATVADKKLNGGTG